MVNEPTAPPGYDEHRVTVARTARWGVLGALNEATTEVWVALHGYAQLAAPFAASATWPGAPGRAFVFPEALQRFYDDDSKRPQRRADSPVGASWMTREARDDDIGDNNVYLDAVLNAVHDHAPGAVLTVLGFSQGGATAVRWAASRAAAGAPPHRLIVWASALPPEVDLTVGAPLRHVQVTIVYGTRDRWISETRANEERARLANADFPATFHVFEGGHRLDDAVLAEIGGAAE